MQIKVTNQVSYSISRYITAIILAFAISPFVKVFAQGSGEMFYIADDYIDNENFTGAILKAKDQRDQRDHHP